MYISICKKDTKLIKKLRMTKFILIYLLASSYSNAMTEEDPGTPQVKRLLFR